MKKKITFFVYDLYQMGGIEKVVTLIANELCLNYDVEIISLYKKSDKPFYKLNSKIKVWNILEEQLDPIKLYYPYLMYKTHKALKNLKTDVFVCAGMGYVGLNIFMRKKAKYVAWEHSNSLNGKVGGIMWLGRKLSAKYADKIVVLTKKDEKINIEKFHSEGKIVQIYNPIEKMEMEYKYNENSKLILSSGRLEPQKGFDMLVEVAKGVLTKHTDWEWHIYGDGPDKEKLQNMINENGLENNLKLMGRTNKMNELYKEYAFFVLTSRYEGFCMVNIEAHYAKLPIVSFKCNCGPEEIIQEGKNGYLIDCFDTKEMVKKINHLIEESSLRKDMSENTMLDKDKLQMSSIITKWHEVIKGLK